MRADQEAQILFRLAILDKKLGSDVKVMLPRLILTCVMVTPVRWQKKYDHPNRFDEEPGRRSCAPLPRHQSVKLFS